MHNIKPGSLFLAPMEGITDQAYRLAVQTLFPGWDYMAADFLRIPSQGLYKERKILSHYGEDIYRNPTLKSLNYYQILAAQNSKIEEHIQLMQKLRFDWIDLNVGCPSKTVSGHGGGSYLLHDLKALEYIARTIRKHYNGHFTAKIRLGFHDDKNFLDIISLLENCGVEAITIHARTREQMYKGRANWNYIKTAVKHTSLPIIGNGDVWTLDDIDQIFNETNCHGIMCARGALKTPWLAYLYKEYGKNAASISQDHHYMLDLRREFIPKLYDEFESQILKMYPLCESKLLKRFKSISRYLFDDFDNGEQLKRLFLRSQKLDDFKNKLDLLSN